MIPLTDHPNAWNQDMVLKPTFRSIAPVEYFIFEAEYSLIMTLMVRRRSLRMATGTVPSSRR